MKDGYNRTIDYLKLSVTDRRAYDFSYEDSAACKEFEELLLPDECRNIAAAFINKGIEKIRLTLDPLMREDVMDILTALAPLRSRLFVTTASPSLGVYAADMRRMGVEGVNINIDTLNRDRYRTLTDGASLDELLNAIERALSVGFDDLRLNVYFTKTLRDKEFSAFLDFSKDIRAKLKLIELPSSEVTPSFYADNYVSLNEFVKSNDFIRTEIFDIATARSYSYRGNSVLIVTPDADGFCKHCNSVKVSEDGFLYPCSRSDMRFSLSPYLSNVPLMESAIDASVKRKIGGRL